MPAQPHTVKAPGASLYYETQGSGPILLLIPGGPTDAGIFAALAAELADSFTVVSVDPRGNSRSTFDAEPVEQDMDVHGDDMARIIDAVGQGPAFVLGSSGGAQIGLNLAARHPGKVKALIAHEPPCISLTPEAEQVVAQTRDILEVYRSAGIGPAMQKFGQMSGLGGPPPAEGPPPSPEQLAAFARIGGNMDYFVGHGIWPISTYRPDVAALKAGAPRVVVGVGEASKGQLAHRAAEALAQALGEAPVIFPGDHGRFGPHAKPFAEGVARRLA